MIVRARDTMELKLIFDQNWLAMIDTMLFYSVWKKISIVRALKRNFQLKFDVNLSWKRKILINVKFVIESD